MLPPGDIGSDETLTMDIPMDMLWKISRPKMYVASVTTFLFAFDSGPRLDSLIFWLGLIYVMFPFNLFLMGWNDIQDYDIDVKNPRKGGSSLYGALATPKQLDVLPLYIALCNVPFFVAFWNEIGVDVFLCTLNMLAGSFVYNGVCGGWPLQLSRVPVADVAMNIWLWLGPFHLGVLVSAASDSHASAVGSAGIDEGSGMVVPTVPVGVDVEASVSLTVASALFMSLVLARSQLRGALCDLKADVSVGKCTIATLLGKVTTLRLLMAVWFMEGGVLGLVFREFWGALLYGVLGVAMVMGRLRIGHMYQLTGAVCSMLLLKRWYVNNGEEEDNTFWGGSWLF